MGVTASPRRFAAAAAFIAASVAALTGCGGAAENPTAAAPTAGPSASAPAAPSPTGSSYTAAGLDLCARVDLAPLAELELTVTRTDPAPPVGRPGAACLFEMRTRGGQQANLRVEASTPATAEEAGRLFQATGQVTAMTAAGPVPGVGEEAEAFTKQSTPGFDYAEYLVHARTGNLVVKVWLAVGGDSFTPTATLAEKSLAILRATQAAVPTD